jgi:hypothetical protein
MPTPQAVTDMMKRAAKIMDEAEVPIADRTICYKGKWYKTDENGDAHSVDVQIEGEI